jgi:hypothetical protein
MTVFPRSVSSSGRKASMSAWSSGSTFEPLPLARYNPPNSAKLT